MATVAYQENPNLCLQILKAVRFQVFRGAYILLRVLAATKSQEAQGLLQEIQRQPSVFVLSGPATVITNIATASAFLADGWSTESVSRVVGTAWTSSFTVTRQGLEEDENLSEDTTAQDDQEDETEQSLSESLQTRRQISKIHENMGHPSNRTLVRVLRLGGAKRRFILAAAKHSCGACEAQKRPAGPIVSRSLQSLVFNDVVGLDLFFLNTYEKHTLPAMNIVCWGYWSAACLSPAGPVGRHLEERTQKLLVTVIWKASHPCCRPGAQLVFRVFLLRKLKAMGPDLK